MVHQLDGPMMNLALSKMAAYHRMKGDNVSRQMANPDLIYYSAIFSWTAKKLRGQQTISGGKAVFGGYPFNDNQLPKEAEYLMPAYDLWEVDYSLGYTSRGCIRKCSFCIVPDKEGWIRDYQPVEAFHDQTHKKIVLLDNNFFASPKWKENLAYINDNSLKVSFCQGLDLRLMNETIARELANTKYYSWSFSDRELFFAFDNLKDELKVRYGLDLLLDAGIPPNNIYVYVLVGHNSTHAEDYKRCSILWDEYRVHPFVMKYNNRKDDIFLNALARWGCRPAARRKHTFDEYCEYRHGRKLARAILHDCGYEG